MITQKARNVIQTIQELSAEEKALVLESLLKSHGDKSNIQTLTDLQAQFPDEWLAIVVPAGENFYAPQQGVLVAHHGDKTAIWQHVAKLSSSDDIYVFFTGKPSAKGFGITFYDTADTPKVATVGD
jgi:hypothetical protein